MSEAIRVKLIRPYDSVEAYLQGDAWTIDRTSMILVGQGAVAPGAVVRFDVVLRSGEAVMRGEGIALDCTSPLPEALGGLRVRFTRFGLKTKARLKHMLQLRSEQPENLATVHCRPPATTGSAPAAAPVLVRDSAATPSLPVEPAAPSPVESACAPAEKSGVHHRYSIAIVAPKNRDELLDRLRNRARRSPSDSSANRHVRRQ